MPQSKRRSRDPSTLVVAITGAARGIGRATAEAFAEAGARVAIGDLDADRARDLGASLGGHGGALDVTDRESYGRWLADAERRVGPVDVLVSNAGIMPVSRFAEESVESVRRQVDVNVHGVLTGIHLVLPGMLARGRGHLVNVSSSAGRIAVPGGVTYCGTKAMVYGISEALRQELRGTGVDVSCVLPGVVNTELTAGLKRPGYVKEVQPADVAAAMVDAVRRPRAEVWVPRSLGRQERLMHITPRAVREPLARAMKADRFLLDYDHAARAAYAERADRV